MGDILKDLRPGQAQVLSFVKPGLLPGQYVVDVQQPVSQSTARVDLHTTKTIHVEGLNPYRLPPGSLHSFYPGEGEAVENRILPHLVLSDAHIPWDLSPDGGKVSAELPEGAPVPWLALLVFTADELSTFPSTSPSLKPSATLAVQLSKEQLRALKTSSGGPKVQVSIPDDELAKNPKETINTIFVNSAAFRANFASQTPGRDGEAPDIAHFSYFAHVRRSRSTQAQNVQTDSFGIVVGHRTGPLDIRAPVTAYAHLVSLQGIEKQLSFPRRGASDLTAMVSLHSWTFSWAPDNNADIHDTIKNLSEQVRPMAWQVNPSGPQNTEDLWMKRRMESGYTFVKHRLPSGETTMALFRGPLMPQRPHGNEKLSAESSNHGAALQIIDQDTGFVDISYTTAWNLGRSLALENTGFTVALSTLRAKISSTYRTARPPSENAQSESASQNLPEWFTSLRELARDREQPTREGKNQTPAAVGSRWRTSRDRLKSSQPLIEIPSIDHQAGLGAIREMLGNEISMLLEDKEWYAREPSEPTKEGLLLPKILSFIYNEILSLRIVPHNYLFPEPDLLDTEAILTFYIDPLWLDALTDGALSIGNHDTMDEDIAKNEIKRAINRYLAVVEAEPWRPRLPSWGTVVCGKILRSFGDPRIYTGADPLTPSPELLATTKLHENALLLLFNCGPESLPRGLTISQPPHQQRFAAAAVLKPSAIHIKLPGVPLEDADDDIRSLDIQPIDDGANSDAIDFATRCLKPFNIVRQYAREAKKAANGRNIGSFDEMGSSALMSLALSDKLLELTIQPTQPQIIARRALQPEPFQLHVKHDQADGGIPAESSNVGWNMRAQPVLDLSAASFPLGYRRDVSEAKYRDKSGVENQQFALRPSPQAASAGMPAGGLLNVARLRDEKKGSGWPSLLVTSCQVLSQFKGADGNQCASLLVHIKAGSRSRADTKLSHIALQRLRIALPFVALLVADSVMQPVVRVLHRGASGWSAGSGNTAIWPPPSDQSATEQSGGGLSAHSGPAFVVELTAWVPTSVRDVDIQLLLSDMVVSAAIGKDVLLHVMEDYAAIANEVEGDAETRTVTTACAVNGLAPPRNPPQAAKG